jgi:hypothetical protein
VARKLEEGASPEEIAKAISELDPKEAAFFLAKLEALMRKRKIQLTGYLVSLGAWLVAMFLALLYYGSHDGFVGWVFLVPFALVGVIFFVFGKWAERAAKSVKPMDLQPKSAPPP